MINQQLEQNLLTAHLRRGVEICITSWPTLRHALSSSWISENKNLNNNPRIASYKKMSTEELTEALINELETYILNHEVEAVHLEDWFQGLMDEVFCADVEDCFVKVMAKQLIDLIQDLENGNTIKLKKFEEAYDKMKAGTFKIERLQNNESDSDSDDQEGSQEESGEEQGQGAQKQKPKQQTPMLTQQQKALEDDGWTVVKKKK